MGRFEGTHFLCAFVPSSYRAAMSGSEALVGEQPRDAAEAGGQTDPEAGPHLPQAPAGKMEVSCKACL